MVDSQGIRDAWIVVSTRFEAVKRPIGGHIPHHQRGAIHTTSSETPDGDTSTDCDQDDSDEPPRKLNVLLDRTDTAIDELTRKIESGRIRDPEKDKVRIQYSRALDYMIRTRLTVTEQRELDDLSQRLAEIEAETEPGVGGGRRSDKSSSGSETSQIDGDVLRFAVSNDSLSSSRLSKALPLRTARFSDWPN